MKILNFQRAHFEDQISLGFHIYKNWQYVSMNLQGNGYYVVLHFFTYHWSFMFLTKHN